MSRWWCAGVFGITMYLYQDIGVARTTYNVYTHGQSCGCCCGDHSSGSPWKSASSASLRAGKTVSVLIGTDGYSAGLFFGNNTLLEVSLGVKYDEQADSDVWVPSRVRSGLAIKHFRGNSFYSQFGLKHDQYARDDSGVDVVHQATTYATFGLGHQWQWNYFTMGVRWAEVYVPVMNRAKVQSNPTKDPARVAMGPQQFKPHFEWLAIYAGISI